MPFPGGTFCQEVPAVAAKAGDGLAPLGEQLKNFILLSTPVVVDCSHRSPPWGWLETEGGETVITYVFFARKGEISYG